MTVIAVDGLSEEDFRRAIENRLREGKPEAALERLRRLLAGFAGPDRILPERFLTITAKDLVLRGWQELEPAIQRHDRPARPITALSIAFGWPGEDVPQPDAEGCLRPFIETGYYTDDAYPFSQSARDDLLDGYSYHGCTWAADCEAVDNALSLEGVDDLHGALAALEARLLASDTPDPDEILAGSLGACLLSVLLFQAVGERIERDGLPRPLCVMAGSNGVYPYFDAPVAGFPEEVRKAAEAEEEELGLSTAIPAPRYSSLLMTGVPRGTKRAVLVLQESEEETAARFAHLRDQSLIGAEPGVPAPPTPPDSIEPALPEPEIAELPASPLLAKKQPGKAWDFRDMLSPRDPDAPPVEREEADWDDWSEPPSSADGHARAPGTGQIDWTKPFAAPPPLGLEPPAAAPEPVDWNEPLLPGDEPLAAEPEPIDWDLSPEAPEPDAGLAPIEAVDGPEAPQIPAAEQAHEPEPVSIDWGELPDVLEPTAESALSEPVEWPEDPPSFAAEDEPEPEPEPEPGSIDWGDAFEPQSGAPQSSVPESGAVEWPEHLAKPGFSLLEPGPEASVAISYAPLPRLKEAEPESPEPHPHDLPIPDWPLGLGWLEDHAQSAPAEVAGVQPRPGWWARLRAWFRR